MQMSSSQKKSAEQLGISLSHYDIDGHLIYASPTTIDYFIEQLQFPPNTGQEQVFHDVVSAFENEPIQYDLTQLTLPPNASLRYQLLNEQNQVLFENITPYSVSLSLPALSFGYYRLEIFVAQQAFAVQLLVAPRTAYQPPFLEQQKAWGINVQLYSLRSQHNWGIGDFADLAYLIEQSAAQGADFVGINPLHLLYPSVPEWASPYSSSSRRWLNFIYLDITALPEFKWSRTVQNWFKSSDIANQIQALREQDAVNYSAVTALKLNALEQLFAFSQRSKSAAIVKRRDAFSAYQKEQGEALVLQGLFNVLDKIEHADQQASENTIGWLGWREEWQHLTEKKRKALIKQYKAEIDFFAWLQWLTEQQLNELKLLCQRVGMRLGIYGDLAVNSSRGSVDVWSQPSLYCVNASVGAPPDPLGPVGQNWNLPPYNPSQLKATGFAAVVAMLRANMRHFGVLRIDHVMGLFRLWLIPEGKTAADGVYVHYPFNELMAILAIESQRNQCLIIGEDLGTVADEVRWKLNEFRIFSYFVLYFAQRNRQYPYVDEFPRNAFATIGTHDVPSLQSFWHCRDLALFDELNILKGDVLAQKYEQRVIDKQALLDSLHRDGYLPPDYQGDALTMAMHDNLNHQIHRYLANSRSALIGIQLENLTSQEISFNLPGTSTEYPNWQKKIKQSLEFIFNDENLITFFAQINQARKA